MNPPPLPLEPVWLKPVGNRNGRLEAVHSTILWRSGTNGDQMGLGFRCTYKSAVDWRRAVRVWSASAQNCDKCTYTDVPDRAQIRCLSFVARAMKQDLRMSTPLTNQCHYASRPYGDIQVGMFFDILVGVSQSLAPPPPFPALRWGLVAVDSPLGLGTGQSGSSASWWGREGSPHPRACSCMRPPAQPPPTPPFPSPTLQL